MSTDCLNELPSRLPTHRQFGMFANIRKGPRYKEDFVKVTRNVNGDEYTFNLYYRVYNPLHLHSSDSPPLLVVHGGPSLPSDYLYPLAYQLPNKRSIIFYDQLGCGKSTSCEYEDERLYSIEDSVEDLDTLITSLGLLKFHILGHSFGGILAYEYTKNKLAHSSSPSARCMSLVLANAPCNMKISLQETCRLEAEITHELTGTQNEDSNEKSLAKSIKEELRSRHECRTRVTPEPLVCAIQRRGRSVSWSSPEAIGDYVALPCAYSPTCCIEQSNEHHLPPTLLVRGEFDFITEKCIAGWRKIFDRSSKVKGTAYREVVMKNCAHYCHLEDEQSFAEHVKNHLFINDY